MALAWSGEKYLSASSNSIARYSSLNSSHFSCRDYFKVVPAVERQETKLSDQGQRALLYAEEQVCEIGVVVVIHFHASALYGAVHEHRAAAAEHIYEARIVSRGKALYDPQELALAADPRDEAFQTPSPPRKLIIEHSSPVMAASIPSRIRRRFLMVSYTSAAVSAK